MAYKLFKSFFLEIEAIPPLLESSHYPSLDGLRGIAIIMVVLGHLSLPFGLLYGIIFNGKLGVVIFFVLSGFLITTLLIKEKVVNKEISLKKFYLRRALRIFPVAYLFIVVLIALNYIYKLQINYISILGAALYITNISSLFRRYYFAWDTAHFWSLSVEEQFYLIIPLVLQKNFKAYLVLLIFVIFFLPVFIWLQSLFLPLNNIVLYAFSHYLIKFLPIATGCLFSVLSFKYPISIKLITRNKLLFNLIVIFVIFYIQYDDFFNLRDMFSCLLISLLVGYLIVTNIIASKDIVFRFLNTRFLKFFGVLSYSLYIWQQLFTSNDKRLPGFLVTYPFNVVCLLIWSCISYYFYERYFLRLKSRINKFPEAIPVTYA